MILLLDNHSSHLNYDALCYAKEHHIHLLTIPPHGSHQLQPLDVGYFAPFKLYYGSAVEDWLNDHPGQVLTMDDFLTVFGPAFNKVRDPKYAEKGFKQAGLIPLNRKRFDKLAFLLSTVTNQEYRINLITDDLEPE